MIRVRVMSGTTYRRSVRSKAYLRATRKHIKTLIAVGMPERAAEWKRRIRDW